MAAQSIIGLDIGFHSIKAVELGRVNNNTQLISLGSIAMPEQAILGDNPNDEKIVVDTIGKLFHDMKVKSNIVNTSLPESSVYTRVIEVPRLTDKELAASIHWEAEQYIPLPIDQVNLDYAVLGNGKTGNTMQVLLVAAPLAIIERYTRILSRADLVVSSIETDAISILRVIPQTLPEKANILLINIGARSTDICIVRQRVLTFVRTVPSGGDSFTRAIAEELGFALPQAEEYKRAYGLDNTKLEGKIAASIAPVFSIILEEIKKILVYFREHNPEDKITTSLLFGGSAKLPGLMSYIASETGIDTILGNPFENIYVDPKIKAQVESNFSTFAIATGLALKEFVP
ncbi:hypothetical protein A2773_00070 [Candidatus Gottesmanbacteria bacterium RIFCSPHIGHO2_01_FULL_39_10]|uniref:SHS2 domain-containing protein n=1 Tax=Candidatus Gottesmanbacteria bacterium RIFCSPHIGHO2_01_FULL_39_10 TaxID=1798375 RepID=A0A1F5ZMW2_9BACT|nr:MAG: hypothetical protein A2773_00070 [Candidatus Gottesmanbacteria bacterium RIFCSPHIGHO2_01_FULL_39_10]